MRPFKALPWFLVQALIESLNLVVSIFKVLAYVGKVVSAMAGIVLVTAAFPLIIPVAALSWVHSLFKPLHR
jgi:hypothetical protein